MPAKEEKKKEITLLSVRDRKSKLAFTWTHGDDKYNVEFKDNPLPAFYRTLKALAEHVAALAELPAKDVDKIEPTGVTIRHKGDARLVLITAKRKVRKGARVINLSTPLLPMHDDAKEDRDQMDSEESKAIDKFIIQAKKYLLGERAQGQLAFENDDDPEDGEEKKEADKAQLTLVESQDQGETVSA